jgi:MarR family transcriptional regulator, organic hydroperoxide resistance regulator
MIEEQRQATAHEILEIIPLVMRVFASDLRHSGHGIVPAQFRLLGMLSRRAWTLTELAETQSVSLPTMSNTISTLEVRGWVTRTRSDEDRRVVLIEVTPEGRAIIEKVFQRAQDRFALLLANVTENELETLTQGLQILHSLFESGLCSTQE